MTVKKSLQWLIGIIIAVGMMLVVALAGTFSVTLPTELPITVAADGTVTTSNAALVSNTGSVDVVISGVSIEPQNGWSIESFAADLAKFPVNSKKFAMKVLGTEAAADGTVALSEQGAISAGSSATIPYDAKIAIQGKTQTSSIANCCFVINSVDAGYPMLAANSKWYSEHTDTFAGLTKTVNEIEIVDSYAPTGDEAASWDISVAGDESVNAYIINKLIGAKVIIAGNGSGKIRLNPTSQFTFGLNYLLPENDVNTVNISSISGLNLLDTSEVVDMAGIFTNCGCVSLNLSSWDTAKVKNMDSMFCGCQKLISIDLTGWDTSNVEDMSHMFDGSSKLATIKGISEWNTSKVKNISGMFASCKALTSIDLSGWNTTNVTDMGGIFEFCRQLTSVGDLATWDTSKVTNMKQMFDSCPLITNLNLSGWDTRIVTTMTNMFRNCGVKRITLGPHFFFVGNDISLGNTGEVWLEEDSESTYYTSIELYTLTRTKIITYLAKKSTDVPSAELTLAPGLTWYAGNPDKSQVTKVTFLESVDTSLPEYAPPVYETVSKTLIKNSHTTNLTSRDSTTTGYGNSKRTTETITIPGAAILSVNITYQTQNSTLQKDWVCIYDANTTPSAINYNSSVSGRLMGATKTTTTIQVTGDTCKFYFYSSASTDSYYGYWADVKGYDAEGNEIKVIERIKAGGNDNAWDASAAQDCSVIGYVVNSTEVIVAGNGTGKIVGNIDSSNMFTGFSAMTTVDFSDFNSSLIQNTNRMFSQCTALASLDLSGWDTRNVSTMINMFSGCSALTAINLTGWDTSNVTNMTFAFSQCTALISLDLSGWDTSNVTNMEGLFFKCGSLTNIDLTGWDFSEVNDTDYMFSQCTALASLDLSEWNIHYVHQMNSMFQNCTALTDLNLSGWNVGWTYEMGSMFSGCSALTNLNLSGWNIKSLEDPSYMFYNCAKLTSLDLSGWNTSDATDMTSMFSQCSSLETIYASELWNTEKVVDKSAGMFLGCTNLVGAIPYDQSRYDVTFANYTTGYFTYKPAPGSSQSLLAASNMTPVEESASISISHQAQQILIEEPSEDSTPISISQFAQQTPTEEPSEEGGFSTNEPAADAA